MTTDYDAKVILKSISPHFDKDLILHFSRGMATGCQNILNLSCLHENFLKYWSADNILSLEKSLKCQEINEQGGMHQFCHNTPILALVVCPTHFHLPATKPCQGRKEEHSFLMQLSNPHGLHSYQDDIHQNGPQTRLPV